MFLSILMFIYRIKRIYSIYDKLKEDIENSLLNFNRFIIKKINETSDIYVILCEYIKYSKGKMKDELEKTVSELRLGNGTLALENLKKRINSDALKDIIEGLILLYSGEDTKDYFILCEIRLNSIMESKIEKKAKSYQKIVKIMTIISLFMFVMTYAVLMYNLLSSSLSIIF